MSKEYLLGVGLPAGGAIAWLSAAKAMNALKPSKELKDNPLALIGGIAAIGAVGTGTAAVFKKGRRPMFIEEGFVGVRTRRDQVIRYKKGDQAGSAKIVEKGFQFAFPLINTLRIISIQDRSLPLGKLLVEREEGQYEVDGAIVWGINRRVADRSVFKTDSLLEGVRETCQSALRVAAMAISSCDLKSPGLQTVLFDHMAEESKDPLEYWGAELRGFNLASFARTTGQMNKEALGLLSPQPDTSTSAAALIVGNETLH